MKLTRRDVHDRWRGARAAAVITRLRARRLSSAGATSAADMHPQVQMIDRIGNEVKEKSGGEDRGAELRRTERRRLRPRHDRGWSPPARSRSPRTALPRVGQFLPQLSMIEAPYLLARCRPHGEGRRLAAVRGLNKELVAKRGMRMLAVTYYGKRHLTSGSKQVKTVADMAGFKLRVPPGRYVPRDGGGVGRARDAGEFQRALSRAQPGRGRRAGKSAADDPEREAERGAEVPRS